MSNNISNSKRKNSKWAKDGRLKEIATLIDNGTLKEYNLCEYVNELEYMQYKSEIKSLFSYQETKLKHELNKVGKFNMEVIYFTGESGTGKTTLAKMIAKKKGYSTFISDCTNDYFDGYKGEECVILDNLKGSVFDFSDLLKITDNHNFTFAKCHFKNKLLACKLLMITTVQSPDEFLQSYKKIIEEEKKQFYRRLTYVCYVEKENIEFYKYDESKKKHVLCSENFK